MTALASYSTGTVSVADGGTTVTGVGTIWSGVNVRPGDILQIGEFQSVISDVVDTDELTVPPWGGGAQSGVAYTIWQVSPQRFAGATAMATVNELVAALNTSGFFVFVDTDETEPDPSLGDDGQYAFQPTTGAYWIKTGGVWAESGSPAAGYGGSSTTSLTIGTGSKVFTTQSGLAYDGARVRAAAASDATKWMEGVATYSGTTLTLAVNKTNGSGTFADWTFAVAGEPGAGDLQSANNLSDVANPTAAAANLSAVRYAAQTLTTAQKAQANANLGGVFGQCQLSKSGSNLLLLPKNGNLLTVNGLACAVPDAGVTLAASGLSSATFYYIYATASAGAINALEASTTVPATQNGTGIKIKTGDSTRTLVGAAYTDTGPAWADTDGKLWVLSYFNRRRKKSRTLFATDRTTTSNTLGELNIEIRGQFIAWSDEIVDISLDSKPRASAAPNQIVSAIAIDSTSSQFSDDCLSYAVAAGVYAPAHQRALATGLTENAPHYATCLGRAVSGGFTATWDSRTTILVMTSG